MKHLIIITLLLLPTMLRANDSPNIDQTYIEFAKTMGLHQMLDKSIKQTNDSMKKQMVGVKSNIYQRLPHLTEQDKETLDIIINEYLESITASIDIDKASTLYIAELTSNMTKEEIGFAIDFYNSQKGQKAQYTIASATQKLQTYILTQIEYANSINHPKFMNELDAFLQDKYSE